MKKVLLWVLGFLIALVFALYYVSTKKNDFNWSENYKAYNTEPFGLNILNNEISTFFPDKKVERKFQNFAVVNDHTFNDSTTYIFINELANVEVKQYHWEMLLKKVKKGAQLIVSSKTFPQTLVDSLNITIDGIYPSELQVNYNNVNAKVKDTILTVSTFSGIRVKNAKTLMTANSKIVAIQCDYGSGNIILNGAPQIFSNYYLLKDKDYQLAQVILNHIKHKNIVWFNEDFKPEDKGKSQDLLAYIWQNKFLKWALWLSVFGVLLFILFHFKRKQRIIPIINQEINQQLYFVKNIASLYMVKGDYEALIRQRIFHFKSHIHQHYNIYDTLYSSDFVEKYHKKSNHDKALINKGIQEIKAFENNPKLYNNKKAFLEFFKLLNTLK